MGEYADEARNAAEVDRYYNLTNKTMFLKLELDKPVVATIESMKQEQGKFGMSNNYSVVVNGQQQIYSSSSKLINLKLEKCIGHTVTLHKVEIGKGRTAINVTDAEGQEVLSDGSQTLSKATPELAKEVFNETKDDKFQFNITAQAFAKHLIPSCSNERKEVDYEKLISNSFTLTEQWYKAIDEKFKT